MFYVPQPQISDEETVEGCILIHLPDSAKDVEIVLQALIKRECVMARTPNIHSLMILTLESVIFSFAASKVSVSLDIVTAFLRLGRKYDLEGLRVEALQRIFYETPTTIEDYDGLDDGSQIERSPGSAFWLDMVNLANEQNLQ